MPQTFEHYPRPFWLDMGVEVKVIGEPDLRFIVMALTENRVNISIDGQRSERWEPVTKIYRPGRFNEDYAATHAQLELPGFNRHHRR